MIFVRRVRVKKASRIKIARVKVASAEKRKRIGHLRAPATQTDERKARAPNEKWERE